MFRKSDFASLRNDRFLFFALVVVTVFVMGMAATDALAAKKAAEKPMTAAVVDLNSATAKELEGIKGVGAATAKKIIAGRPYKTVDELSKAGLGAKAVEAIRPFVTVGRAPVAAVKETVEKKAAKMGKQAEADASRGVKEAKKAAAAEGGKTVKEGKAAAKAETKLASGTRVNLNTADLATLEKLPGIGPVKAQAIIDGRPYKAPEDVMKVKGIKGKTFDAIKDYIVVK